MIEQMQTIPLSVPLLGGNEWEYVKQCLDTGWVSTAGAFVDRLENEFCRLTSAAHAVACAGGTAALHTALMVANVRPDDEVIVPTVTFIAPVNAASYVNAHPVFMDCDEYYNIDVEKTLEFIENETLFKEGSTYNKLSGRRIAAVVVVHVFGNAADIQPLLSVCAERNIKVIEDAAEAVGTRYISGSLTGRHAGTVADIGCFSFNGNKIVTAGGGGMMVTDNPKYAQRARYLTTQAKDDVVEFLHNEIGYNYRLTNISAAIAVAQMEQLELFLQAKHHNYMYYKDRLDSIEGLCLADSPPYAQNNHWMYPLRIDDNVYPYGRKSLMHRLHTADIHTRPLWHPNHLQKPYAHCQSYKIETALRLHARTLCLPCSTNLTADDMDRVIEVLTNG